MNYYEYIKRIVKALYILVIGIISKKGEIFIVSSYKSIFHIWKRNICVCMCACMLSWFSHVWLFETLWTLAHHTPLSMGFCRQENWSEWVAMPSSKGSSQPRDWTPVSCVSCLAGRFFTTEPPGKLQCRRHRYNFGIWKIPWRKKWWPTPVFLPGKSHGRRILVHGVAKKSDTT